MTQNTAEASIGTRLKRYWPTIAAIATFVLFAISQEWIGAGSAYIRKAVMDSLTSSTPKLSARDDARDGHARLVAADEAADGGDKGLAESLYRDALAKLVDSAKEDVKEAHFLLGLIHCTGRKNFITKDTAKGRIYLEKASELGEPRASVDLQTCK